MTQATTNAASAKAGLQHVVLVGGAQGFNWLPVFIARNQGLFEQHGLNVELRRLGSLEKATAAVRDGEADLAISPPEGALANAAAGGNLRVIGANANCLPLTLVAKPKYKRVEDLKGAVLGTSSLKEGTAIYTQVMLEKHGLHFPGDYDFAMAGVHQDRWTALQAGTIDAAVQPPPFNFLALDAGFSNLGEVSDYVPQLAFTTLLARADWLQTHGDAVLALMRAVGEAIRMVYEGQHDRDIVAPVMAEITQTDMNYAQRALDYMRGKGAFAKSFVIPDAAIETTLSLMVKHGLLAADAIDKARAGVDMRLASQV